MQNKNSYVISEMYCCKCGKKGISVPRNRKKFREAGHLKKLYCPYCRQEWNHVEIRPPYYTKEDFKFEMRYGNFDEQGNRKVSYKVLKKYLIEF